MGLQELELQVFLSLLLCAKTLKLAEEKESTMMVKKLLLLMAESERKGDNLLLLTKCSQRVNERLRRMNTESKKLSNF